MPLFDLLAFEYCFATTCLSAFTGTCIGYWHRSALKENNPKSQIASILEQSLLHLGPSLAIILLNALRVRNCNFEQGLLFFAALPLISSLYGAALGLFFKALTEKLQRPYQVLCFCALVCGPLITILFDLYREPTIFAFDHLWGYFPGSLYDEGRRVTQTLVIFRGFTLLRIIVLCLAFRLVHQNITKQISRKALVFGLTILFIIPFGLERTYRQKLGFYSDRAWIEENLSTRVETGELVIHFPETISEEEQDELVAAHTYYLQALKEQLKITNLKPIHSYVYESPKQKEQLMGGSNTMIAKPWLNEIHIHQTAPPHPILAHELVHAIARTFGSKLLGVSAKFEVLVNMGIVEGLAEALTPVRGPLDLHQAAKALFLSSKAPPLEKIIASPFFWTQSARRAYSLSGSFIRFLLENHGAEPLKLVYANADFDRAYGKPLQTLIEEWRTFIDNVELLPHEVPMAQEHFKRKSIFNRPCAHEISYLKDKARNCTPTKALQYYRDINQLLDDSTSSRYELALALARANADEEFNRLATEMLGSDELSARERYRLMVEQGTILWQEEEHEAAQEIFRKLLDQHLNIASDRAQWVKIWGLSKPVSQSKTLLDYLQRKLSSAETTLFLQESTQAEPDDKTWPYLLGRHLYNNRSYERALEFFLLAIDHPFELIDVELQRLLAETYRQLDDGENAQKYYGIYATKAPLSGERARAAAWLKRLKSMGQD